MSPIVPAMVYVDLNPIRAGMTRQLGDSRHTSIARRLKEATQDPTILPTPLAPMAGMQVPHGMPLSAAEYISLVDWTGRQLRPDKKGVIPKSAPTALSQLNLAPEAWVTHVRGVGSGYWRAVGPFKNVMAKAAAMGQRWLKGLAYAAVAVG